MATYDVTFYDYNPGGVIPTGTGSTFTWAGPATADGRATITDTETGIQEFTLDDDSRGGETATANVTLNGLTSTGSSVDAELVWTLRDTVTGETFQVIQFDVENGAAAGDYTLSEVPLVVGRTYEVLDYDSNPNVATGSPAFNINDYTPAGEIVEGTSGDDTIDASYIDADGNRITTGDDTVLAGEGNDSVAGSDGADSVLGGGGSDTLNGGNGDDVIYGGNNGTFADSAETLDWSLAGADEADISAGFTQTTGEMDVSVTFTDTGNNNATFTVESTDAQYVDTAGGETFSTTSSVAIFGDGDADTGRVEIEFAAATAGSAYADEVENVSFRINDIDSFAGNHIDIVTVTAFDADGNAVAVTLSNNSDDTIDGNTVTAGPDLDDPVDENGSLLVEIAGPVSRIVIDYANGDTVTHGINVTNVEFTAVASVDGADQIDGGAGNDTIYGELGADTILGGDGNDYLQGSEQNPGGVSTGGTNTAGSTFSVINLGTYADVDPDETNGISENASDLLGTYGGLGNELYNSIQTAVTSDTNGDNTLADNDSGATPENITIDGVTYQLDSTHVFTATVTFLDGSTGTFTAVVSQMTTGETFLMPEFTNNADNALLTSQPIVSISLDTLDNDNTGLVANRVDADYETPGTSSDTFGDSIEGGAGDDTLVGDRGNDTLIGGTGADVFFGGLDDDEMYLAEGDVADGGDGDDLFVLGDLGEAGASTITITGGEGGETNGDTLQLTSDVTQADITFTNTDDAAGGLSGNFTLADGTVVTFSEIENIICFTPGTRILTPQGERAIETLKPGDLVITRDSGPQPIRWLGHSTVPGRGKFAPVAVNSTVLDGARRPLLVSPQHRLLFTGYKAELLFGTDEVLVAAKHLVDGKDVRIAERRLVTYFHMMLDRHEVIYAEGAATESFHANDVGISAISEAAREDMFRTFPQLRSNLSSYGATARQCLRGHEARLLVEPHMPHAMAA